MVFVEAQNKLIYTCKNSLPHPQEINKGVSLLQEYQRLNEANKAPTAGNIVSQE